MKCTILSAVNAEFHGKQSNCAQIEIAKQTGVIFFTCSFSFQAIDLDSNNNSLIDYSMSMMQSSAAAPANDANKPTPDSFSIAESTGIIRTVAEFAAEPRIFRYTVTGRERFGPPDKKANTTISVSLLLLWFDLWTKVNTECS